MKKLEKIRNYANYRNKNMTDANTEKRKEYKKNHYYTGEKIVTLFY